MDNYDERLIEEVRKCNHLYDASDKLHKDDKVSANSWREISQILERVPKEY